MGEKALVESQVSDAIELIKRLDSDGIAPTFAVWYYYDDAAEWRLLLGGSFFDALLPNQEAIAYRKVVDSMAAAALSSLSVSDIKLVSSQSQLPKAIRLLIQTPLDGVMRAHFTDTTLDGIFIKEMVVLRAAP